MKRRLAALAAALALSAPTGCIAVDSGPAAAGRVPAPGQNQSSVTVTASPEDLASPPENAPPGDAATPIRQSAQAASPWQVPSDFAATSGLR